MDIRRYCQAHAASKGCNDERPKHRDPVGGNLSFQLWHLEGQGGL